MSGHSRKNSRSAGMTQPALSRLEQGDGVPTTDVLDRIAPCDPHRLNDSCRLSLDPPALYPNGYPLAERPDYRLLAVEFGEGDGEGKGSVISRSWSWMPTSW
jgi:transcriptional regulator with XRE-family HTH domain